MQKIGFCERYMLTTAVLNRTKELTRRVEKALERTVEDYKKKYGEEPVIKYQEWVREGNFLRVHCEHGLLSFQTRYKPGEVVAVAQSYKSIHEEMTNGDYGDSKYDAFRCAMVANTPGWSNKMFVKADLMPHQIQITGVRIERLQDITDEDCLKEGVVKFDYGFFVPNLYRIPSRGVLYSYKTPREAFAALIDRHGVGRKGLWESNPWVIVYEFKIVKP